MRGAVLAKNSARALEGLSGCGSSRDLPASGGVHAHIFLGASSGVSEGPSCASLSEGALRVHCVRSVGSGGVSLARSLHRLGKGCPRSRHVVQTPVRVSISDRGGSTLDWSEIGFGLDYGK